MTGQVIVKVVLRRVLFTGVWNEHGVEDVEYSPVRELYFVGRTRAEAERAWYRSEAYRDHGALDWTIAEGTTEDES